MSAVTPQRSSTPALLLGAAANRMPRGESRQFLLLAQWTFRALAVFMAYALIAAFGVEALPADALAIQVGECGSIPRPRLFRQTSRSA